MGGTMKTPIRPGPHIEYKATLGDGADLRRAGLPATPANPAQGACSVVVTNTWVMRPINAEWMAAYRLVIQDGAFVVGELRIYPVESVDSGPGSYSLGDWSGIWRGLGATVPDGGLTNTRAREAAKMNPSLTASRGILRDLKRRYPAFNDLQEYGLATFDPPKPVNPSGGTLGRPRGFYRAVAKEYARARQRNSRHPNQDVMLALKMDSNAQARDAVYKARKLGFLPPTTRGRAKS